MDIHQIANQILLEQRRAMDEQLFAFLRIHNLSYASDYDGIMNDLRKKRIRIETELTPSVNGKMTVTIVLYKQFKTQQFDLLPPEFNLKQQ